MWQPPVRLERSLELSLRCDEQFEKRERGDAWFRLSQLTP